MVFILWCTCYCNAPGWTPDSTAASPVEAFLAFNPRSITFTMHLPPSSLCGSVNCYLVPISHPLKHTKDDARRNQKDLIVLSQLSMPAGWFPKNFSDRYSACLSLFSAQGLGGGGGGRGRSETLWALKDISWSCPWAFQGCQSDAIPASPFAQTFAFCRVLN